MISSFPSPCLIAFILAFASKGDKYLIVDGDIHLVKIFLVVMGRNDPPATLRM